jgi:hypothetical protein
MFEDLLKGRGPAKESFPAFSVSEFISNKCAMRYFDKPGRDEKADNARKQK